MADTGPAEFVRTLGNEALGVIRADMAPAQKRALFHQLLQRDFDVPGIAATSSSTASVWRCPNVPNSHRLSNAAAEKCRVFLAMMREKAAAPTSAAGAALPPLPR
jgi:hypothetical protein